jgi:hypothetical protein
MTPIMKNVWGITFSLWDAAIRAVNKLYLKEHGLNIWLLLMRVFRKGFIRGIPLDCFIDKIKAELHKSNPELKVTEVSRLKRRVKKGGYTEWVDTVCHYCDMQ